MSKKKRISQKRVAALILAFMIVFAGLPILGMDSVQAAAGDSMNNPIDLTYVATATPGTVDGNVWIDSAGLTGNQDGYEPGIIGVPLIIQWQDADGVMSPFYRTYTREGGLYRVYLPEFTDVFGNRHKWRAGGLTGYPSQKIRVQVDPDWLENDALGKTLQVTFDWLHGNFGGVEDPTGPGWLYVKGPAAERIEGYYITLQPKERMHYHLPEDQWREVTTPAHVQPLNAEKNTVRGKVYWDWEYTPYLNINPEDNAKDIDAVGVDVLLTIYDRNDLSRKIATYHTKTNAEGRFLFDLGRNGYAWTDPDGDRDFRKVYISIIPPESANDWSCFGDRGPLGPTEIKRGATGYADGVTNNIYGVRFALIPRNPTFDILEYDTTSNFASPGTEVQTLSTGLNPSSGVYKITWTNKNTGKVVKEYTNITPNEDGTIREASYTVPDVLTETTIFEATLSGPEGRAIGRDAFAVAIADAVVPIGAVDTAYMGQINSPGIEGHTYKYAVDPATPLPDGLILDENTGAITGKPAAATAGAYAMNFIVKGKGPDTDVPEYLMMVKEHLYIFDANVSGKGMEDHEIKGKAKINFAPVALPTETTLERVVTGLPSAVQFVDGDDDNLVNKPAVDADSVTTAYDLGVKYTFKYPDPKNAGQFITETVTQLKLVDPLYILEKLVVTGDYPDGYTNIAYESDQLLVVGGEASFKFTVADGSEWPQGLVLKPDSGAITGTPAEDGIYDVTIVVTDKNGYTAALTDRITIISAPSAKPIELKQDFYTDAANMDHQVVTGGIEGFTPEMVTNGTKVTLVDAETGKPRYFADPDDIDPDTGLPKQKPIEGVIKTDGSFEIPIGMDEIQHLDEVKVELAEPDKVPTPSDDKVIIDKLAPSIENPTANQDAGIIELKATTDDPKGVFVIQVGDQYYGANVDELTGEIIAQYPGTQEGTPKILAQDEFGNLRELEVAVEEKEAFSLQVGQTYAGNRRILMRAQIPYASIYTTIVSGDQRIELPVANADDVGRLTVSLSFRLKAGDIVECYAESDGSITDTISTITK